MYYFANLQIKNIMKNKLVKIGIVVAVALLGLFAYKKINAAELHGDFSASYNSELSFRGVSTAQDGIQTTFDTSLDLAGFEIGIGGLVNTRDGTDEVQLQAHTGVKILEGIDTSIGVVNYTDNHVLGNGTEVYAELGLEIILDPSVRVYHNPDGGVTTVEGSLSQSFEVWENYSLGVAANAGNTELGGDRATYYGVDTLLTRAINEDTSLFVGVDLTDVKDVANADEIVSVFGGIQHTF